MMILGNKCDLEDSRVVTKERGSMLAAEYGIKFFETSAKSDYNVKEAFLALAQAIKEKMDKLLVVRLSVNGQICMLEIYTIYSTIYPSSYIGLGLYYINKTIFINLLISKNYDFSM